MFDRFRRRQRRPLIEEHTRKFGLVPSTRRRERRIKRLEHAPKTGDTTITRVSVVGAAIVGAAGYWPQGYWPC